jgi:hypothetical protein
VEGQNSMQSKQRAEMGETRPAVCTDRVEAHLQRLRLHLSAHDIAATDEID